MKSYEVKFTSKAENCLIDIGKYIAKDNPARAISFVDELYDSIDKTLSVFPLSSPVHQDIDTDVEIRRYVYQDYNCYYYISEVTQAVNVLFIYNSAKEVKDLLIQFINKNKLS